MPVSAIGLGMSHGFTMFSNKIVIIIELWDFSWSLPYYAQVSVLVLGIGIAKGQYYWVLDIGCLSWYRSNPINQYASYRPVLLAHLIIACAQCNKHPATLSSG